MGAVLATLAGTLVGKWLAGLVGACTSGCLPCGIAVAVAQGAAGIAVNRAIEREVPFDASKTRRK